MIILLKYLVGTVLIVVALVVAARLVFVLPPTQARHDSKALAPVTSGVLAEALARRRVGHEGLTGIATLQGGADAFAARILLAEAAVASIDVQ